MLLVDLLAGLRNLGGARTVCLSAVCTFGLMLAGCSSKDEPELFQGYGDGSSYSSSQMTNVVGQAQPPRNTAQQQVTRPTSQPTQRPAAPTGQPTVNRPAPAEVNLPSMLEVAPGVQVTYSRVPMEQRYIALTFDDGPHVTNTPRLLEMLARENVKATFFVVGPRVQSHPALARRIVSEGHEIANHTWDHPNLQQRSTAQVRDQIQRTNAVIEQVTGQRSRVFRPPYGSFSTQQRNWLMANYNMPTILWNVDPEDWRKPGVSVVAERLVSGARPGGILLLHDIHGSSVDAVPEVIRRLKAQGYRFVTVSQLIAIGENS